MLGRANFTPPKQDLHSKVPLTDNNCHIQCHGEYFSTALNPRLALVLAQIAQKLS